MREHTEGRKPKTRLGVSVGEEILSLRVIRKYSFSVNVPSVASDFWDTPDKLALSTLDGAHLSCLPVSNNVNANIYMVLSHGSKSSYKPFGVAFTTPQLTLHKIVCLSQKS